jgi:hypothetical protein
MEKIRTTLTTLVFLFLQSIIFAQIPAIQWTKTYGGVRFDIGISVSQTTDSGYVIAAQAASFSPSDSADFYIIRTNYIGDTIWTKVYGGDDQDWPRSIQQTSDGGFIVVGGTRSYGAGESDVYLVKTDANGDSIWTKTYGTISHEVGMAVQQTSDSGYIIAGWNGDYPDYNIYITNKHRIVAILLQDGMVTIQIITYILLKQIHSEIPYGQEPMGVLMPKIMRGLLSRRQMVGILFVAR